MHAGFAMGAMPVFQEGCPTRGDGADAAVSCRMQVQPSGMGQGSPPVASGVPAALTSPNSPFEPFSPPSRLLGAARPFPCGWLFLPVAVVMALGASRPEAGGRGPYLPGAHQGQRVHLIQHRSILRL